MPSCQGGSVLNQEGDQENCTLGEPVKIHDELPAHSALSSFRVLVIHRALEGGCQVQISFQTTAIIAYVHLLCKSSCTTDPADFGVHGGGEIYFKFD